MTCTFTSYEVRDDGINFHFVAIDVAGGQPNDYWVLVTDTELAAVTTTLQLKSLVQTKLNRKFRATGIATKLDSFIGQSLTV